MALNQNICSSLMLVIMSFNQLIEFFYIDMFLIIGNYFLDFVIDFSSYGNIVHLLYIVPLFQAVITEFFNEFKLRILQTVIAEHRQGIS
jgi:hypothetical protein